MGAIASATIPAASFTAEEQERKFEAKALPLSQFEPRSMLRVHESRVERARFPAIDFHTHISFSTSSERGVELSPERHYLDTPQELLAVMDRKNLRAMVNLTGGYDQGLSEAVSKYDRAFPGRFYTLLSRRTHDSMKQLPEAPGRRHSHCT